MCWRQSPHLVRQLGYRGSNLVHPELDELAVHVLVRGNSGQIETKCGHDEEQSHRGQTASAGHSAARHSLANYLTRKVGFLAPGCAFLK